MAPKRVGAVVALGDSITDGYQSGADRNARYPNALARRLARAGGDRASLALQNAGIAGNRVLADYALPTAGPSALNRLQADVLDQVGVSDALLMEGTNDIGPPLGVAAASADEVIAGLELLVRRLQAGGLNVIVGSQTPSKGTAYGFGLLQGSPRAIVARNRINHWIRTSGVPDAVVDFHAALRDPVDPNRLRRKYDSGNHLHPSEAGYEAMAQAVPLRVLRGPACAHPIALAVRPRRAAVGAIRRFSFRVTEVRGGRRRPLAGVHVRFGGERARTASDGRATIRTRLRRAGRREAWASRPGFASGRAAVRVIGSRAGTRGRAGGGG